MAVRVPLSHISNADETPFKLKNVPSPASRYYRPELDALRFFAFMAVFLHHLIPDNRAAAPQFFSHFPWLLQPVSTLSRAGAFGLPLFFLLSAFLIAELLMAEREKTGTIHIKAFMIRRILRIWPLYYIALGVGFLLALHHHHSHDQIFFIASCAIFLGNWSSLFNAIPWENPFGPLWSISVEEQFYLLFPACVKALKGKFIGAFGLFIMLGSFVYLYFEGMNRFHYDNAWYNSGSQAMYFGAGMAIAAYLHNKRYEVKNVYRVFLLVAAFAICYVTTAYLGPNFVNPGVSAISLCMQYALVAIGCSALLFGVYRCGWSFPQWMVSLGKISYGLYVFHTFSMFTFAILLKGTHLNDFVLRGSSILMTIALATLSYRFIELPFLRLKHRFSFVNSRPD